MHSARGYYLSAEYLIGRHMQNAIANLDLEQQFKDRRKPDSTTPTLPKKLTESMRRTCGM